KRRFRGHFRRALLHRRCHSGAACGERQLPSRSPFAARRLPKVANGLNTQGGMIKQHALIALAAMFVAAGAYADWQSVAPGVDFQEFREANYDIFVTRIDLTSDAIRVVASRESDRGTKVSDFAKKVHAIAAING